MEDWLTENNVKTLQEYRDWRQNTDLLPSSVIGIKSLKGHGCPQCKFAHDRVQYVTTHMQKTHSNSGQTEPIPCIIQPVFASNLRSFWKIADTPEADEIMDEGLLALRQFSAEFQQMQLDDPRSAIGIYRSLI
jgi:hypothetical protein